MELCVLIPAKNEEETLRETIETFHHGLNNKINFNILVVNDYSNDGTLILLNDLSKTYSNFNFINNDKKGGVGNAIKLGLSKFKGELVSICMADCSDSVEDILESYRKIVDSDYQCVFGSRFIDGGKTTNYPKFKLLLNRVFNKYVQLRSSYNYNDYTNLFKTYSRSAVDEIMPLSSEGFSLGLEMSLKSFNKKLRIIVIPISWVQRTAGESKLKLGQNFSLYMQTLKSNLK